MTNKAQTLKIKINNQNYLNKLIKKYPQIKSGRKKYYDQHIRVLKNILLAKFFEQYLGDPSKIFNKKFNFNINNKFIKITCKKRN